MKERERNKEREREREREGGGGGGGAGGVGMVLWLQVPLKELVFVDAEKKLPWPFCRPFFFSRIFFLNYTNKRNNFIPYSLL